MRHNRNPIHENLDIRDIGNNYLKQSVEVLAELGGDTRVCPVYSAVGALVGRGAGINMNGIGV